MLRMLMLSSDPAPNLEEKQISVPSVEIGIKAARRRRGDALESTRDNIDNEVAIEDDPSPITLLYNTRRGEAGADNDGLGKSRLSDIEEGSRSSSSSDDIKLTSTGSWDAIIAREIEQARRVAARSTISDPTGLGSNYNMSSILKEAMARKELEDQRHSQSEVLDFARNSQRPRSNATPRKFGYVTEKESRRGVRDGAKVNDRVSFKGESRLRGDDESPLGEMRAPPRRVQNPKELSISTRQDSIPVEAKKPRPANLCDEKKESDCEKSVEDVRKSRLIESRRDPPEDLFDQIKLTKSLSMTESDVGSLDGLPSGLRSTWLQGESRREKILKSLDGIQSNQSMGRPTSPSPRSERLLRHASISYDEDPAKESEDPGFFSSWPLRYLWGGKESDKEGRRSAWQEHDDTFAILGCANMIHTGREPRAPVVPTSLVRVTSEPPPPSYAETIRASEVDPRLPEWVDNQYAAKEQAPVDGSYNLGKSRAIIVHEIVRGDWTWCTAWSPNGNLLAVATENHHLAVVDTTSSAVWRVIHDEKLIGPVKNNTTHSIRSIAWGADFIAIGGTGNAVSILEPVEPYQVLHTVKGTGFVGSLSWKPGSSILAIGSRLEKSMIVRISATNGPGSKPGKLKVESSIRHTLKSENWVNSVAFSPGGSCLAIGEAGGSVVVYNYYESEDEVEHVKSFTFEDSVLNVEWSPDGKWLYVGGEDFNVTVIDTNYWEVIHRIKRNRWVQCVSASTGGTHVAVGGVSSEVSILDVKNGWDRVMGVELKGLVPLWAQWHPKDQYLALTGQNNSILVVETTNARHVKGHHLHSISPILGIEFSPDGRTAIVGNDTGIVTFFSLSGLTFTAAYELVVTLNDRLSIKWSMNGLFAAIGTKNSFLIVSRGERGYVDKRKPPSVSGFAVAKVIRNFGEISAVSIDSHSQYVAVSGDKGTYVLDATQEFRAVKEWKNGECFANAWSSDARWLSVIGSKKVLTIYDTSEARVDRWRPVFSLKCNFVGFALAWGPTMVGGLLYLAYGGDDNTITIMEIRTHEGTWETVLRVPRDGPINALDWNTDGLLAAAIGNGTVSIVNVSYLQSGVPVSEMDYNWQRQALTCFTEIRRNRGSNSMTTVRWIPSAPGSDSLLAVGGSDGELEIVDLTRRHRCSGFVRGV